MNPRMVIGWLNSRHVPEVPTSSIRHIRQKSQARPGKQGESEHSNVRGLIPVYRRGGFRPSLADVLQNVLFHLRASGAFFFCWLNDAFNCGGRA